MATLREAEIECLIALCRERWSDQWRWDEEHFKRYITMCNDAGVKPDPDMLDEFTTLMCEHEEEVGYCWKRIRELEVEVSFHKYPDTTGS